MATESNPTPDILLITVDGMPNPFAHIQADAERAGLLVAVESNPRHRMQAAALDWQVITPFVLFLLARPTPF